LPTGLLAQIRASVAKLAGSGGMCTERRRLLSLWLALISAAIVDGRLGSALGPGVLEGRPPRGATAYWRRSLLSFQG
jgi:hypothetical protein